MELSKTKKIYIAGHTGLVGKALVRNLVKSGYTKLLTRTADQLDLRCQAAVDQFFEEERPSYIFIAAAKVGGIQANITYPATFLYDNLMISTNLINAAYRFGVEKLLFFGSSCIYPVTASQPINEAALLTGPLEKTNEPYAVAKIAAIKLCQSYNRQYGTNFISCMPTNLYGPGDNFDHHDGHVIPALIAKIEQAHRIKADTVILWGDGTALREFLYVDDLAAAALLLMRDYQSSEIINIGSEQEITIRDLAALIKELIGYQGEIIFDQKSANGVARKLINSAKIQELGWRPLIDLPTGLRQTINWYKDQVVYKGAIRTELYHDLYQKSGL